MQISEIISKLPDPIIYIDNEYSIVSLSPSAENLFNLKNYDSLTSKKSLTDILSKSNTEVILPLSREKITKEIHIGIDIYSLTIIPINESGFLLQFHNTTEQKEQNFITLCDTLASTNTLQSLLEKLIGALKEILNYSACSIFTLETDGFLHMRASVGLPKTNLQDTFLSIESAIAGKCAKENTPILISDATRLNAFDLGLVNSPECLEKFSSLMATPITIDGKVAGVLQVGIDKPMEYTQTHLQQLSTISSHIGDVLSRAKIKATSSKDSKIHTRLYEIGVMLSSVLQTKSLLTAIIETIANLFDAEECSIYFHDELTNTWIGKSRTQSAIRPGLLDRMRQAKITLAPLSLTQIKNVITHTISTGKPEIIPDVTKEPRYESPNSTILFRSQICIPLHSQEKVVGAISVESTKFNRFTSEDLSLLNAIAPMAVVALRNACLHEEIQREASRFTATLTMMPDGFLMMDSQQNIIMTNDAYRHLLGIDIPLPPGTSVPEKLLPHLLSKVLDPEPLITFFKECATHPDKIVHSEISLPEQRKYLRLISYPVRMGRGEFLGRVILKYDVTAEKEVEIMREEFVQMLTHDLKNPLGGIISTLELALDRSLGEINDDQEKFLTNAMEAGQKIIRMLNDLLDGYKTDAMKIALEKCVFNLVEVAKQNTRVLESQAKERGIILEVKSQKPDFQIKGDPEKLGRVITNLLSNALKFSPSGGKITVDIQDVGEGIQINVRDQGEGISSEDQRKIFDKFYQVEVRKAGRRSGTGLGLTLCKNIVEAHGGKIWVESKPHEGSTFSFILPSSSSFK